MLIWLENAPVFGVDKDENVIAFIGQTIIGSKPENNATLLEQANTQTLSYMRKKVKEYIALRSCFKLKDDNSFTLVSTQTKIHK